MPSSDTKEKLKNMRINKDMFQTFQKRRYEKDSWCIIDIFLDSHVVSQEKAIERKVHVRTIGTASVASNSRRSNFSSESVSKVEMESQMGVSVASTCNGVEMEAMCSEIRSCNHDLAEAITRQSKRITSTVLEQEIADL